MGIYDYTVKDQNGQYDLLFVEESPYTLSKKICSKDLAQTEACRLEHAMSDEAFLPGSLFERGQAIFRGDRV